MAVASLIFLYSTVLASLRLVSSSSAFCPTEANLFLYGLQSQCSGWISPNPPLQADGDFLDRVLASKWRNEFTSVLFYASWCPFSCSVLPTFATLSSMFPQMEHVTVEKSSAMPSLFSRYGIHSLPSVLLVNSTSRVQYRGPKNLSSLVRFYKKTTGLEPVQYFTEDQPISLENGEKSIFLSSNSLSLMEILKREPYLVFSISFLCLRLLLWIFPEVLSQLKAFWVSYIPHFNVGIFAETSQIMGRILHMIDVRRVWTKLRLCKTRNFHEGAKNARVWASSFASVALGESSSAISSS